MPPLQGVRKASFGRTNLFIPDPNVVLRSVRASNGIGRRPDGTVYHLLAGEGPPDVCCWHCSEHIRGERFRLPKVYDSTEHVFHVYGFFCAPACAKAHILEKAAFDRGHQINVFMKMMRDIYGHSGPIVEAPPRAALKRFGGPCSPTGNKRLCRIVEPPFVSYCMLVEEQLPNRSVADTPGDLITDAANEGEEDIIEPPNESPMYTAFLQQAAASEPTEGSQREKAPKRRATTAGAPAPPSEQRPTSARDAANTLRRFAKAK